MRVHDQPLTKMVNIKSITWRGFPNQPFKFGSGLIDAAASVFIQLNGELPHVLAVRDNGYNDAGDKTYTLLTENYQTFLTMAAAKRAVEIDPNCDCITAFVFTSAKAEIAYHSAAEILSSPPATSIDIMTDLLTLRGQLNSVIAKTHGTLCSLDNQ